jgi:hypothetical protein
MLEGTDRMGETTPLTTGEGFALIRRSLRVQEVTMSEGDVHGEYFYNTRTRMVERGRLSPWEHLMGPYGTLEEAEEALETAKARNEEWDDEDAAWNDEDDEPLREE